MIRRLNLKRRLGYSGSLAICISGLLFESADAMAGESTGASTSPGGIARVLVGSFDGSISRDVQCGTQRIDCKVIFSPASLDISDGSKIDYTSVVDIQGSALAQVVECSKELPTLPYTQQGRGFPCWAGTPSWYTLIAHKEQDGNTLLSVFSFKNERVFKEFLINMFAARFSGGGAPKAAP